MNARHFNLFAAACIALGTAACERKKNPEPYTQEQQWLRVQNDFEVIRLIDSGHDKTAFKTFERLVKQDAAGDRIILRDFASGNTNRVRATLNMMLDGWIISEACHSQSPQFTVLLDNPDRLRFLARLGTYRKERPSPPVSSEADKTVAEILLEAQRRVKTSENENRTREEDQHRQPSAPTETASEAYDRQSWHSITNYAFSFSIPTELKKTEAHGIDSFAEEYVGDGISLGFDYGIYSNSFNGWPEDTTYEDRPVDGEAARIGTAAHSADQSHTYFDTQIHFKAANGHMKLSMHAWCRSERELRIAKEIFLTIRFIRRPPKE